jgi:hypothetical protein
MKFLYLFGANMSVEFDKLKIKVAAALAEIAAEKAIVADRDAKILLMTAEIEALKAATPVVVDVSEADFAALSAMIDAALPAAPAESPIGDPIHPALV